MAAGPVVSVGVPDPVGGGTGRGWREVDGAVERVGRAELDSGMAGNGGTAVWVLSAPLAKNSAMTKPTTSITDAPAKNHNQRGDFGPSGSGGASSCRGSPPDSACSSCQYAGNSRVGFASV